MWLFIKPEDPDFEKQLERLQPTTGYCIFADIVGSTEMKSADIKSWIRHINNTFANIGTFLTPFPPLKVVGDEMIFFIPQARVDETRHTALHLFADLVEIAREKDPIFRSVKIAVTYCNDVYAITFVPETSDFYGRDIDLTARLLTVAESREIIMNEAFVLRVRECYDATGNKEQFPEVNQIIGPWLQRFKGFKAYIPIYKLPGLSTTD